VTDLTPRTELAQLCLEAEVLLQAAGAGDAVAIERLAAVSGGPVTVASAELAVARGHGFVTWAGLVRGRAPRDPRLR
jgi:hypothetical protein